MANDTETVALEMTPEGRLRLYGQVTAQMEKLGYNPLDYASLDLGFELPSGWPIDMNAQPTLAQLTVLAHRLKMRIIIGDLNLAARQEPEKGVEK